MSPHFLSSFLDQAQEPLPDHPLGAPGLPAPRILGPTLSKHLPGPGPRLTFLLTDPFWAQSKCCGSQSGKEAGGWPPAPIQPLEGQSWASALYQPQMLPSGGSDGLGPLCPSCSGACSLIKSECAAGQPGPRPDAGLLLHGSKIGAHCSSTGQRLVVFGDVTHATPPPVLPGNLPAPTQQKRETILTSPPALASDSHPPILTCTSGMLLPKPTLSVSPPGSNAIHGFPSVAGETQPPLLDSKSHHA